MLRTEIAGILAAFLISLGIVTFFTVIDNPCTIVGNKVITKDGIIELDVNFTKIHKCKIVRFVPERNDTCTRLKLETEREPSYVIDEKGNFVKFSYENTTLRFYPMNLTKDVEKKFILVFGEDNLTVAFIGKLGRCEYQTLILGGG
ncbi:MAG: hypothetical protein DRP16_04050 [Candidatus Aenigmatarchaeota archaeon]|nr:MAG: hypothetical protein DRP16_04050 [Candidatus Aenigmarchaeota archaeon]